MSLLLALASKYWLEPQLDRAGTRRRRRRLERDELRRQRANSYASDPVRLVALAGSRACAAALVALFALPTYLQSSQANDAVWAGILTLVGVAGLVNSAWLFVSVMQLFGDVLEVTRERSRTAVPVEPAPSEDGDEAARFSGEKRIPGTIVERQ